MVPRFKNRSCNLQRPVLLILKENGWPHRHPRFNLGLSGLRFRAWDVFWSLFLNLNHHLGDWCPWVSCHIVVLIICYHLFMYFDVLLERQCQPNNRPAHWGRFQAASNNPAWFNKSCIHGTSIFCCLWVPPPTVSFLSMLFLVANVLPTSMWRFWKRTKDLMHAKQMLYHQGRIPPFIMIKCWIIEW